jgi:hypothetical protein
MAVKKQNFPKGQTCRVRLAVAAVEDSGRPLDLDAGDADSSPTSLGLPAMQESNLCPHRRWVCADCGVPLCVDAS